MHQTLVGIAVLSLTGCSAVTPQTSTESLSIASIVTISAPSSPTAVTVQVVEQVGSLPFDIGPLPANDMPRLSVADVIALVPTGAMASRFFMSPSDVAGVSIRPGLITDHSAIDGTTANDPTFVGYVVEGGHSTCLQDGPPPSNGVYPPASSCHALFILNGNSGKEVGGFLEIGD
jgi:hypothetical protein